MIQLIISILGSSVIYSFCKERNLTANFLFNFIYYMLGRILTRGYGNIGFYLFFYFVYSIGITWVSQKAYDNSSSFIGFLFVVTLFSFIYDFALIYIMSLLFKFL